MKKMFIWIFDKLGFELTVNRKGRVRYISCKETVEKANAANLSVCDYVEKLWHQEGSTELVINNIMTVIKKDDIESVCEIGPGTGRYIEHIIKRLPTLGNYCIYELDSQWAQWLENTYKVKRQPTEGNNLKYENNNIHDLIHAHGVFVTLNLYNVFEYLNEMIRATKTNGYIVFDYYNESSFSDEIASILLEEKVTYPVIIPEKIIKNFISIKKCKIISEFENKHGKGISKYIILQKNE
ncbi:MAG: class I SAM-dependent methyltransferase [Bacteroidetes bacterium]|nr:class I SAM-dependent methyltransferase [Bacteroidota bacterium]